MAEPPIHPSRRGFSASSALDALGEDLAKIREDDKLTWAELGEELGKGKDQAMDYAKGLAEMSFTTFLRGCRRWNGRFGGRVLQMIGKRLSDVEEPTPTTDREKESRVLAAALALSVALADDEITEDEIVANRPTIENAIGALEALLARLKVRAA